MGVMQSPGPRCRASTPAGSAYSADHYYHVPKVRSVFSAAVAGPGWVFARWEAFESLAGMDTSAGTGERLTRSHLNPFVPGW